MKTNIYLIGTLHQETVELKIDQLISKLEAINPDLICVELTSDFFTSDFQLKTLLTTNKLTFEDMVLKEYLKTNDVKLRPYDIEGRNQFYKSQNTFILQSESYLAIENLYNLKKLSVENMQKFEIIKDFMSLQQSFYTYNLDKLNSKNICEFIIVKNKYFSRLADIINTTPELKKYSEFINNDFAFEKKREIVMAENILNIATELKLKNVAVLMGCNHKPYIYNSLEKIQDINLMKY